MATWETVCELLGALPGTQQGRLHDNPAVRVGGKLVAFLPSNRRSRPPGVPDDEEFLVVKTDAGERAALLAQDPQTFFVTPHWGLSRRHRAAGDGAGRPAAGTAHRGVATDGSQALGPRVRPGVGRGPLSV